MTETATTARPRIAVGQMNPKPGAVADNLARIGAIVGEAAAAGADLVILPETATTGYFIADRLGELAEPADGPTATALAGLARRHAVMLAVGMVLAEGNRFFDTQMLFGRDGRRLAIYRKTHLFAAERQWYAAGNEPVVVDTPIGRLGLSVCYDLIFPDFIRKLVDLGAETVINSTNWITNEWQTNVWGWSGAVVEGLAATRALENGIWLAMADCIGPEAGFDSLGHSCIAAPSGRIVASVGSGSGFAAAEIVRSSEDLDRWRAIATYRQDRRPELY